MRRIGHDVERESCIGKRIEQAIIEHEARTMMPFFAWLEHEIDGARQLFPACTQHLGGPDQHGNMRVVPAGMHGTTGFGGEFQSGVFMERQCVHIAAQQHCASV